MRIFKNKFFIIALCTALAITVCATVLSIVGVTSPLRSIFGTIFAPIRWCASQISQGFAGFTAYFTEFDRISEENAELRAQLAELERQLAEAEAAKAENDSLREYFGLESLIADWELLDATVIAREAGSYTTLYTLNRGSFHGIEKNMPVITSDGLVGYVREVGPTFCKVVPITETTSSVGAYVKRSGAAGVVQGDFALRQDGLCTLVYADADADILVGDMIVTAGTGTIYPAGITIGYVTALEPDEFSRTYKATITPAADLAGEGRVMIITSYDIIPADEIGVGDGSLPADTDAEGEGATEVTQ